MLRRIGHDQREIYSDLAVSTTKVDYMLFFVVTSSCCKCNYPKCITIATGCSPKTQIVAVEENRKKFCACEFSQIL